MISRSTTNHSHNGSCRNVDIQNKRCEVSIPYDVKSIILIKSYDGVSVLCDVIGDVQEDLILTLEALEG